MAPIRILQIMPAMDAGGMETFVMNVYRTIDRDQVQFDFLYHYDKPCFFDDEICTLGGNIYKMTVRQDNNLPRYLRELRALFAAHPEWRIIHGHYSGFGMFYNPVARRAGIPVRVGHSHNTAYELNLVGQLDRLMSSRFSAGLTDRFACSQKAGEMLFGQSPFTVLPNGIDTARTLRRTDPDLPLVFVTSSPEYVWDAFPVHPFDYLLKPYREEKLFQLADELRRVLFRAEPELEVRIARQQVHLPLRKIQYAMAQNHYVRIVSDDGECRAVSTFSQVEQLLRAQENFLVCNRGVILNMDKVLRLDSDCFEMLDGTRLPVRQKDKNTLFAQFTQYQFRHMRREL